jgi:Flp pilus assembly protein TadB
MEKRAMDREQAEAVADALLEQDRRRQQAERMQRLRRRWRHEATLWRNRRALALATVAVLVAGPVSAIVGLRSWEQLAMFSGWKPLLLWVGLPVLAFGMWRLRMPPECAGIEEL